LNYLSWKFTKKNHIITIGINTMPNNQPKKTPKEGKIHSPYNFKETVGVLWRNARGVKSDNPGNISFCKKTEQLNKITPKIKIGFIGDIMDMNHKIMVVSDNLKDYFKECDVLIGNIEATITDEKKKFFMDQMHDAHIIPEIVALFDPKKTFLSVANNHAGDFSDDTFQESIALLKKEGYNIFGEKKTPYIDINQDIRIYGVSNWSNKKKGMGFIANFDDLPEIVANQLDPQKYNILYPHWGYELELYPRIETIDKGKVLIQTFDVIIGHHSHIPQPITIENAPISSGSNQIINKPLAYSLADFCFGRRGKLFEKYYYGIIVKMEIGPLKDIKEESHTTPPWAVGQMEWSFIESSEIDSISISINLADKNPYFNI
jgi:poly-gamma-glutamate capsule biosynthesis protein CapA/YwtB (metallophosphatase superfamily)